MGKKNPGELVGLEKPGNTKGGEWGGKPIKDAERDFFCLGGEAGASPKNIGKARKKKKHQKKKKKRFGSPSGGGGGPLRTRGKGAKKKTALSPWGGRPRGDFSREIWKKLIRFGGSAKKTPSVSGKKHKNVIITGLAD